MTDDKMPPPNPAQALSYEAIRYVPGWPAEYVKEYARQHAAALAARVAELENDNANLRTVMVAAAEEIQEHWEAHCDAEGYGPANLMRRLECGIPSQYGYTAGAFAELRARVAELERVLDAAREARYAYARRFTTASGQLFGPIDPEMIELGAAIDSAMGDRT